MLHILSPIYRWGNWGLERWSTLTSPRSHSKQDSVPGFEPRQCTFGSQDLKSTTVTFRKEPLPPPPNHQNHLIVLLKGRKQLSVTQTTSLSLVSAELLQGYWSSGRIGNIFSLKRICRKTVNLANIQHLRKWCDCKENLSDQKFLPQLVDAWSLPSQKGSDTDLLRTYITQFSGLNFFMCQIRELYFLNSMVLFFLIF